MLNLEGFMNIRDWKQQGWSISAIADELHLDRKTVRKHLLDAPQPYKRENPAACKIDPYRPFLRERWEKGVHNARKLLDELRGRGYDGGYSQLKLAVNPWREEGRERAFVRLETGPGEQSQMDWGHVGNGVHGASLADLNQQARTWMEKVNHQVHSTTREVPYERLPQERLLLLDEQPDYDTSYMEDRRVAKDCMLSYRGNRYSVPFRFAGKTVLVREPVSGGRIEIYSDIKVIAEHRLAAGRGVMVSDPVHYAGLAEKRRPRGPAAPESTPSPAVLTPGPGVGRGFLVPEVEQRSLAVYEEVADVAAI